MEKASDMDNVKNIVQWARDRNLIDGATKHAQMLKLTEEVGELAPKVTRIFLPPGNGTWYIFLSQINV